MRRKRKQALIFEKVRCTANLQNPVFPASFSLIESATSVSIFSMPLCLCAYFFLPLCLIFYFQQTRRAPKNILPGPCPLAPDPCRLNIAKARPIVNKKSRMDNASQVQGNLVLKHRAASEKYLPQNAPSPIEKG